MRKIHEKTKALDKERFEVACLRQDIIDEYEKKSRELLEYLNNMEAEFEQQQREYKKREAVLRQENKLLKDELSRGSRVAERILVSKSRKYRDESREIETALDILKDETRLHEKNYKLEHKRAEELKSYVDDLQLELQRTEEKALQRKKRMDDTKKRMERDNEELRRKAALGWMLGCLSELYLRVDPKVGGAGIMKLVRKVQRELEAGSYILNDRDLPPKLEYDAIQGEVHRLIGNAEASRTTPLRNSAEACSTVKDSLSRGTKLCNGDHLQESPRRRRRQWQKFNALSPDADRNDDFARPATAPSTLCRLPAPNVSSTACQTIVVNCVDGDHNHHCCHVTCKSPAALHGDCSDGTKLCNDDLDPKKPGGRSTWAETQVMDSAEIAARETLRAETIGLLKGLEKSMNFLLTKERRAWY